MAGLSMNGTNASGTTRAGFLTMFLSGVVACGGDDPAGPAAPENRSPVAVFTVSADTGEPPFRVTFDGSGSSDPDGSISSYAWSFGDGASGSGAQVDHTYVASGSFQAMLTVTDNAGAQSSSQATITVLVLPEDEIRGSTWYDRNANGTVDGSEVGAPGIIVYIDANENGRLDGSEVSATSDDTGRYRLQGLSPGSYRVTQQLPIGWRNTFPGPGVVAAPPQATAVAYAGPPARIIEGEDATISEFPWMVALVATAITDNQNAHFCGGALIAARWVMTAAHCIVELDPGDVQVLWGTVDLGAGGMRLDAAELHVHPNYVDGASFKSDLGLIELVEDVPGPYSFMPISTLDEVQPFTEVVTTGWGRVLAGVPGSNPTLQVTTIPIISDGECEQIYGDLLNATMICAGFIAGGTSPCNGDSGGPLLLGVGGIDYQIGITSWGVVNCGRPNFPNVFAKVLALAEFAEGLVPVEPSGGFDVTLGEVAETSVDFSNAH